MDLTDGISSWSNMETQIALLPSEIDRGEAFEQFCKALLILDPVFQFKEVFRHNEIPPSLRQRLGYPGTQDIGIDGLCVTLEDKLFAYQAKFRSDRTNTPTLRELSTFFTVSDRADWRITIANTNSLPAAIKDRTNQSRILSDRLDQLEPEFFDRLRVYLNEQCVKPPKITPPHKTQKEAIEAAFSYFTENDRGQLILPCGTGKTLAAMWIAEKLGGPRILVMVPSLSLMSQTLREWAANTSIRPFRYLCLCSDTTVDLGNDLPIEHLYEMDVPVTTDVKVVAEYLANAPSVTSILFSTYQSSKVLAEAALKSDTTFDMAIFDEAHRTTGTKVGIWSLALDDKNVQIKKRLFMTATPRIYAPHIVKKAKDEDVLICSMDDEAVYGKPFYEITFGTAIERGHITDYKIVVICVTDSEVREIIHRGGRVIIDDDHEWDAKAFAKRVALVKGINEYGLKKVFTFHSRVKGAEAFTNPNTPYGIHQVFKMLDSSNNENDPALPHFGKGGMGGFSENAKFFHVNGTMSSGVRSSFMKEFKQSEIGIISNARCLTEGVDVPAVDTVAFIDPKKSLIDIVQATGRAMRKAEWKEKGYIFIPVIVEENDDLEKFIESSDFDTVWQVLRAMVDQDQRFEIVVSNLRVMQGKGEARTQAWKAAMTEYAEKLEFFNLPKQIDKSRFINTLCTKTIEIIGKSWDFWYGLTLSYKEESRNANAPQSYKTPEGYNLGDWQGKQRASYKKGTLLPDSVQRLKVLGFLWDLYDEAFDLGFQETLRYKELSGTPNATSRYTTPYGFNLGSWQCTQRQAHKQGKLSSDRVQRLENIGFVWHPFDKAFEKGFHETLRYKEQFGTANTTSRYATPSGYNLGIWQSHQRRYFKQAKLSPEKSQQLESVGFTWDVLDESFEKGFRESLRYKEQFGSPNALSSYITPEGFKLGVWQNNLRSGYKQDKLSSEKVRRLEAVGFAWGIFNKAFEKGFQETLWHKEQFGTPNAAFQFITITGFRLGAWQSNQRRAYKKNGVPSDRTKRLEAIGFNWSPLDEAFEIWFRESVRCKEQTGTSNVSQNYRTPEGLNLGKWQQHQRHAYKKGNMSSDRIKRLEAIGFKWQFKKVRDYKCS